jgi:ubiquinone/menaquinone biosynthesis C-methylase UbiE
MRGNRYVRDVLSPSAAAFRSMNKQVAYRIERHLPQRRLDIQQEYEQTIARFMLRLPSKAIVIDVGAGRESRFARHRTNDGQIRIIGVDKLIEELAQNQDVDEFRVADAAEALPFDEEEVDMIVSRATLEHLPDTEAFIRESHRVLKPDGVCVHLFSSKFAPFAIANQLLPSRIANYLLRSLHPECEGRLGFEAFYDRTYASAMKSIMERNGFGAVRTTTSFYQSGYYNFFIPLYVVSALYELVIFALCADNLASKVMIIARKMEPRS